MNKGFFNYQGVIHVGENKHAGKYLNKCPKCEREADSRAESRFCLFCGADLLTKAIRTCPKCGMELGASDKTCPRCDTVRMVCPACKAPLRPGAKKCSCGWSKEEPPVKFIVIGLLVAIVVIAIAAVLLTRSSVEEYTVFYRCDGVDIADPKIVGDITPGASVTERAIDVDGYTIDESASTQTITVKEGDNNSILFAYEKEDSEDSGGPKPTSVQDKEFQGTWFLTNGDAQSLGSDDVADMWDFGLGSILTLDGTGMGSLEIAGEKLEFEWTNKTDEELAASIEGCDCDLYIDNGSLVLSGLESGKLYFGESSPAKEHSGYILEDSDKRVYNELQLESLTDYELCLARNEMFIKKGLKVESDKVVQHYKTLGLGMKKSDVGTFGPIENANLTTITRIEWGRNSIYRNMLSLSRRDCYRAYSGALDERASKGEVALAQLIDFDGSSDTFEELLVVYSDGGSLEVELLGYEDGDVAVERSGALEKAECLALEEREDGYALISGSGDLEWRDGDGELIGATCYQLHAGLDYPFKYSNAEIVNIDADGCSTLTRETQKTLKADYCDYSSFFGVWLPAIDDVDEAWAQCVKLQALGFDAWKVQPKAWSELDGGEDDFLVTAGRFNTEAEAEEAAERLIKLGYANLEVAPSGEYHDF